MNTCRELIEFLMEYLDGELQPEVRAEFERHLAACPPCIRYLDSYRDVLRAGKEAYRCDEELTPGCVPEELVQAILAARKQQR